jgi:hypothetical protein
VSDSAHGRRGLVEFIALSAIAFAVGGYIATWASFARISAVVSDEISRALGFSSDGPIVLVRLNRDFEKKMLEQLLARAIPALMDNYRAAALGVDIDFSRRGYEQLAQQFSEWSSQHAKTSSRIIWSIGFQREAASVGPPAQMETCERCEDTSCTMRFQPKPVFGGQFEPLNYGLAYVWNDANGMSRSSFRFVCHADSTAHIRTFHAKLVDAYCDGHQELEACTKRQKDRQSVTKLYSWYVSKSLDLCALVQCAGSELGAPPVNPANVLSDKIVILYSDLEGNDEHATIAGTRKGAEVAASLVVNELNHGTSNESLVEALKILLEILLTMMVGFLFHWDRTKEWAILPAGLVFVGYLYAALKISGWVPDFRDYALAMLVVLGIEIWIKAAYQNVSEASRRAIRFIRERKRLKQSQTVRDRVCGPRRQ